MPFALRPRAVISIAFALPRSALDVADEQAEFTLRPRRNVAAKCLARRQAQDDVSTD